MNETRKCVDCEHLYLLKDEPNEVYVKHLQHLKQYQIDALRFLFKQFKKKRTGAIVNFPPACGKSVTVVLFINAVCHLLKLPVLILCKDENEVRDWKENFAKWTEFSEDDIAIESINPLIKKKIFIKTRPVELNSYFSRSWSIVVIKDDIFNKEINKLIFTADYKIWITSADIKKQLSFLSFVYTWLNPKLKVNFNTYETKDNCPTENYQKSVLLETFLENTLIQRNVNMEPFQTKEKTLQPEFSSDSKRPKRSIKNKDATGTKIKRSKNRLDDKDIVNNSNQQSIHNQTISLSKNYDNESDNDFSISNYERKENIRNKLDVPANAELVSNDHDSPKLDVECFIRDQQPLQATTLLHRDLDYLYKFNKKDESKAKPAHTDSLHFTTPLNEFVHDKNYAPQENSTESLNFDDEDQNRIKLDIVKNVAESNQINERIFNDHEDSTESINFHDNFEISKNEDTIINQNDLNGDKIKNLDNRAGIATLSIVKTYKEINQELETNTSNVVTKMDFDIDNNKTENSKRSHKDIDSKISELEKRTLKKFQGSILDNIF